MFLLWSNRFSMCSPPDFCLVCAYAGWRSLCLAPVMLGSCGVFLLVQFMCVILLRMACGRSLSVLRILPTGNVFLSCLVKYVGECFVCVMYVCRWL